MTRRAIVICLDGCGLEYLAASDTPNMDAMAEAGWKVSGHAVFPTVTNVNNTSILTGAFSDIHGITSNYYFDGRLGTGVYMESADYVLAPTIFERLAEQGLGSAFLTSKDKLRTLLAQGAFLSISAESPPTWLVRLIGTPPDLYSVEVNLWLLDAVLAIMANYPDMGFIYVSTTDYVMHTYPCDHAESRRHLYEIDRRLGRLADQFGDADIAITADHGMNAKTIGLDPTKILSKIGIDAEVVPIIKDRHTIHHQNRAGAAYVYLEQTGQVQEVQHCLREVSGIEAVLTRQEAAEFHHLHPDRIGDLVLLADVRTVFGDLPAACIEVEVRSHGSLHEESVPIIGYGPRLADARPHYSKDLVNILFPHSERLEAPYPSQG